MEHHDAIETYAAEGYLLDDLTAAERDAFEQHFADCESCFADVREGVRFIHALPEAAKEEKPVSRTRRWPEMAAAAMIAIGVTAAIGEVALVGPMRAQIARLQQPNLAPVDLPPLDLRAPSQPPTIAANTPFTLHFDVPLRSSAPYTCTIVDAHGTEVRPPLVVNDADARDGVGYAVAGGLRAGDYKLKVTDAQRSVFEKAFQVR